jgi:hypothetical protein
MPHFLKQYGHYALIGLVGVVVIAIAWTQQHVIKRAAQPELEAKGFYRFRMTGTRIPCDTGATVGVVVVYRWKRHEEEKTGRLCRIPDWTSPWVWHPSPHETAAN